MKRKKEEYHKTKIDLFCDLLLYVCLPIILALCCLLISLTAHAEEPTYFPMGQNDNNKITENYISLINERISNNDDKYVLIKYAGKNGSNTLVDVAYWNKADGVYVYGEIKNNGYQWNLYKVGSKSVNYRQFVFSSNGTIGGIYQESISLFQNIKSSLYSTNISYVSNFQLYTTNAENRQVILSYSDGNVIETGHATPPEELQTPVYNQGHAKPDKVPPTYTVNNYTWTTYTPPTVDNSTLEKLLESLTDIVKYNATYLKDNLHNEFANLINNIKGLIDYIGQTIQYYGNMLVETLNNLIITFYNNMVSIGEDITDKLTYIVSPLDTSALQTAIQNTGIYNDYDRIFDMVSDAFGFYNDISEPNTFTIPIDLRNVTILHQTQIVYIDLGWLNSCKTIIRAFMWCVLTFGLLYTIIDSIPDYLQGNDE